MMHHLVNLFIGLLVTMNSERLWYNCHAQMVRDSLEPWTFEDMNFDVGMDKIYRSNERNKPNNHNFDNSLHEPNNKLHESKESRGEDDEYEIIKRNAEDGLKNINEEQITKHHNYLINNKNNPFSDNINSINYGILQLQDFNSSPNKEKSKYSADIRSAQPISKSSAYNTALLDEIIPPEGISKHDTINNHKKVVLKSNNGSPKALKNSASRIKLIGNQTDQRLNTGNFNKKKWSDKSKNLQSDIRNKKPKSPNKNIYKLSQNTMYKTKQIDQENQQKHDSEVMEVLNKKKENKEKYKYYNNYANVSMINKGFLNAFKKEFAKQHNMLQGMPNNNLEDGKATEFRHLFLEHPEISREITQDHSDESSFFQGVKSEMKNAFNTSAMDDNTKTKQHDFSNVSNRSNLNSPEHLNASNNTEHLDSFTPYNTTKSEIKNQTLKDNNFKENTFANYNVPAIDKYFENIINKRVAMKNNKQPQYGDAVQTLENRLSGQAKTLNIEINGNSYSDNNHEEKLRNERGIGNKNHLKIIPEPKYWNENLNHIGRIEKGVKPLDHDQQSDELHYRQGDHDSDEGPSKSVKLGKNSRFTHKQPTGEQKNNNRIDSNNYEMEGQNVLDKRVEESSLEEEDSTSSDTCVEYKADESTSISTEDTTEYTESTSDMTDTSKEIVNAARLADNKKHDYDVETPPPTSSENDKEMSDYERFLSGQLADDFVADVLTRVKRSRKMAKELGFSNETEGSCGRCVEIKQIKIPDLKTMKSFLETYSRDGPRNKESPKCYKVPKPMVSFLNLLLYFEQEHEKSIYGTIQDDSSFIFTGDYSEPLMHDDRSFENNDFGDRHSFNKEEFEKERDEGTEEREDDHVAKIDDLTRSKHPIRHNNVKTKGLNSNSHIKSDDGPVQDEELNQLYEEVSKTTQRKANNGVSRKVSEDSKSSSTDIEENLKESGLVDDYEFHNPTLTHYSNPKGFDVAGKDQSFDRGVQRIRKDSKKYNFQDSNIRFEKDNNIKNNIGKLQFSRNSLLVIDPLKSEGAHHDGPTRESYPKGSKDGSKHIFEQENSVFGQRNHLKPSLGDTLVNNIHSKLNYLSDLPKKHNLLDKRKFVRPQQSKTNSFTDKGWEDNEYQLYPNQPGINENENQLAMMSMSYPNNQNYNDDLKMVKRDTEPSDDDSPVMFDIPEIEYDLY